MGLFGRGKAWMGSVGHGRLGMFRSVWARYVADRQGVAGMEWQGLFGSGEACRGTAGEAS